MAVKGKEYLSFILRRRRRRPAVAALDLPRDRAFSDRSTPRQAPAPRSDVPSVALPAYAIIPPVIVNHSNVSLSSRLFEELARFIALHRAARFRAPLHRAL